MNMTPQEYQQYVKQKAPKSPLLKDTVLAFVVGGAICVVGQLILNGWTAAGLEERRRAPPPPARWCFSPPC